MSDVDSLAALAAALDAPRVVWVMVPSGEPTRGTVRALADVLDPGDLVIDGGNSRYTDDGPNAALLDAKGIGYLDCGVSGGIWGKQNGYGLMAGGEAEHVEQAMPIFDALRPEGPREEGFAHAGPVGAGHFSKMVHNGIEYGLMQAYAEGFELLSAAEPRHRRARGAAGVVPRHRGALLAAGPARHRAAGRPGPGRARRLRRGLRRGPLDHRGGDHPRGAAARDLRGAVRPVRLPAGLLAGHAGGRGAAPAVRRARGQVGGRAVRHAGRARRSELGHRLTQD